MLTSLFFLQKTFDLSSPPCHSCPSSYLLPAWTTACLDHSHRCLIGSLPALSSSLSTLLTSDFSKTSVCDYSLLQDQTLTLIYVLLLLYISQTSLPISTFPAHITHWTNYTGPLDLGACCRNALLFGKYQVPISDWLSHLLCSETFLDSSK